MKLLRTTFLTALLTIFFVVFQQNYVMTYSSTPPPSRTGSPGDNGVTCATSNCHSSNAVNSGIGFVSVNISQNGTIVTTYEPDMTYDVVVEVSTVSSSGRYGFEMTVEDTTDMNGHHGDWIASTNTSIAGTESEYIRHQSASTAISTWTFQWIAPSSDVGNLTFYVAGNMANGSGRFGDFIYTNNITLSSNTATCDIPTGLMKVDTPNGIELSWTDNGADEYQLAGRKLNGTVKVFPQSENTSRTFPLSNLQPATTYQWAARSICNGEATEWSAIESFTTD